MAAASQFSVEVLAGIEPASEGERMPCSPGTPRTLSWESLGLGPAPPTTCVLVPEGTATPPSPATPRSLVTSSVLPAGVVPYSAPSRVLPIQASPADTLRCKRKIDFATRAGLVVASPALPAAVRHHGVQKPQTPSVVRRNERERNRVRQVNLGFHTLRQHVPAGRNNGKMSKVETLRAAVEYIKQLRDLLCDSDDLSSNPNQFALNTIATLQSTDGHVETNLQHLAAACDVQQQQQQQHQVLPQQQLSPGGSLGDSEHTPSPSGYSSSAEENHSTGTGAPLSPEEASIADLDLRAWLQQQQ